MRNARPALFQKETKLRLPSLEKGYMIISSGSGFAGEKNRNANNEGCGARLQDQFVHFESPTIAHGARSIVGERIIDFMSHNAGSSQSKVKFSAYINRFDKNRIFNNIN